MDVLMGGAVVLVGAVALALVGGLLWGSVRALADGRFVTAAALLVGLGLAGYFGRQQYVAASTYFAASAFRWDLRQDERLAADAWEGRDLLRLTGRRSVALTTPDGRTIRMTTAALELRKQDGRVRSVWLCSDRLTSDDAADLARSVAAELDLRTDDLDAWATRRRHTLDRDPPGWNAERRGPWSATLTIDPDHQGFWWVKLRYAR